jgi:hypothetical protein
VILPPLPSECRRAVPHAPVAIGSNPVVVLARERGQLDAANSTIDRCSRFYADVKAGLEAAP